MKNNFFYYLILTLFLILGCSKKDTTQPNNQSINAYIKTITIFDTTGSWLSTVSYEYDAQNRLNKFYTNSPGPSDDTIHATYSMEYNPAYVILRRTLASNNQYCEKITYNINSNSLADSSVHIVIASASDSSNLSNDSFQYNSDSYLMTHVVCSNGGNPLTVTYFYSNSNVDYATFSPANPSSNKELFYYDIAHYNTLSYSNVGIHFLGKSSQNPLIRARMESLNVDFAKYSYEYDQSGRIIHLSMRGFSLLPGFDFYTIPILKSNEELYYTYY